MDHDSWTGDPLDSTTDASYGDTGSALDPETAVDPGSGGTVVDPTPTFGGYSGDYAGMKDAWYSSDGYVYDQGGNRVGTH